VPDARLEEELVSSPSTHAITTCTPSPSRRNACRPLLKRTNGAARPHDLSLRRQPPAGMAPAVPRRQFFAAWSRRREPLIRRVMPMIFTLSPRLKNS